MVPPYNEILFSDKKKNELSSRENTGMNLKCVWLSKRSQSERCITIWLQLSSSMWHFGKGKTMETMKRWVVPGPGVGAGYIDEA